MGKNLKNTNDITTEDLVCFLKTLNITAVLRNIFLDRKNYIGINTK